MANALAVNLKFQAVIVKYNAESMKKILFFLLLFVNLHVFFWDYFKETYPKYKGNSQDIDWEYFFSVTGWKIE